MTTTTITPFAGFPGEGLEFLAGLAENNTREYFEERRGTYESALLEPAKAFVVALGDVLRIHVSPLLRAEPRVNGSILRIQRDTLFTTDKRTRTTSTCGSGRARRRAASARGCPCASARRPSC